MITKFSLTLKFESNEDLLAYQEEVEAYIDGQTRATVELGFWKQGNSLSVDVVSFFPDQDITPILKNLMSEID